MSCKKNPSSDKYKLDGQSRTTLPSIQMFHLQVLPNNSEMADWSQGSPILTKSADNTELKVFLLQHGKSTFLIMQLVKISISIDLCIHILSKLVRFRRYILYSSLGFCFSLNIIKPLTKIVILWYPSQGNNKKVDIITYDFEKRSVINIQLENNC